MTTKISSVHITAITSASGSLTPPPYVPIKEFNAELISEFTSVWNRTSFLSLNTETLEIPWSPNSTYSIELSPGFMIGADSQEFASPAAIIPLSTNPIPYIVSTEPAAGSTGTLNNATVTINFDHNILPGSGNIYFYKDAATDILLKTFNVKTDLVFSANSVTIKVAGLLTANTKYYILTDAGAFKDQDNFIFPQITNPNTLSYTTAAFPLFRELFAIEMSFGAVNATVGLIPAWNTTALVAGASIAPSAIKKAVARATLVSAVTYTRAIIGKRMKFTINNMPSVSTVFARVFKLRPGELIFATNFTSNIIPFKLRQLQSHQQANITMATEASEVTLFEASITSTSSITCTPEETQVLYVVSPATMSIVPRVSYKSSSTLTARCTLKANILVYVDEGPQYAILAINPSIAMSNNYLLIGEPGPSSSSFSTARLIDLSSGSTVHTFTDGIANTEFGYVVAVTDQYSFISSQGYGSYGKVSMYDNSSGAIVREFTNPISYIYFGYSLTATDTTISIGISSDSGYNNNTRVLTYEISTGNLLTTIIPSPLNEYFASDIATNGTVIAAGSGFVSSNGYVKLYNYSTGILDKTIPSPPGPGPGEFAFGNKVGINSTYVITGSPYVNSNTGKAYVYNISTGSLVYTFEGEIVEAYAGADVALDNRYAYVFAYRDVPLGAYSTGLVYVYNLSDGSLAYKITAPNRYGNASGDNFGQDIVSNGSFVAATAIGDAITIGGIPYRSVYVYRLIP